jgi:signal transduction histidine kinase/ligand-binding sensor domain-containing protein
MCFIKTKYILSVALFTVFISANLKGDEIKNILFSSFFAEKNLSSPNITCFFQDSKGYMWIGTENGMNYFNGKTIKVFKHDYLNKNSLPDNLIGSICEDKEGNIWIGTGRGISKLNPGLLIFENYFFDDEGKSLGFKPNVYVDKENSTWVFSTELFELNKAKNCFEKKQFRAAGLKNISSPKLFTGIFEDSKKRYWVTCDDNLYLYFPKEGTFEPFTVLKNKTLFFPVKEDSRGNLYCGTWNGGMFKINTVHRSLEAVENIGIHCCYTSQELNGEPMLWYGNRLCSYNLNTRHVTSYPYNNADSYSPRNGELSVLFVDAQNQLWIGYATKGIQIVSPSNQVFKTYTISEKEDMFPSVNAFIQTKRYAYIGGWYNNSLVRLDKKFKPLKTWRTLIPCYTKYENNISDAWADPHGNIWFTSTYGLIKFDELTEKTELFKLDTLVSPKSHFLQILPEGDSVLWLTGYFSGLSRFSLNTKKFQNWGGKTRLLYWAITRDNSGIIWLADNSGVLTGFDPNNKTFFVKKYRHLTENAIYYSVLFDSTRNALWIASTNGLLKVDRKTFAGKLFTEKDNLPINQVNALQFDLRHRLWIATNKGLCFYDPEQNVFKTFFSHNGLPNNVLNQLFKMQPGGELFIGCNDGFSVLKTDEISLDAFQQMVIIDKVYESGKLVPATIQDNQKTIELHYDQNTLQIEFSSNDLINSEDNQLLYKLEGFDDKWYTAQNGIVNYSKLAPGKYLFQVTGINHSGIKSKHDDSLSIVINPPFWKTTWFIALISLCLLSLISLASRYVFTRILREKILILEKEQAIEKERRRISQDMHDELGSGLTKISIMSEVAIAEINNPARAKNQLENISASSRELVDNLQDIIWILNLKNDSLENICPYIREYALKYFEPFDIHVDVEFPDKISSIKLSEDQRRNILLVFKETFNNISKHSGCRQVKLKMTEHQNVISFTITDNGKGFDKNKIRSFANGLQNMKKRMADINGTFEIRSAPQQGTSSEFIIRL